MLEATGDTAPMLVVRKNHRLGMHKYRSGLPPSSGVQKAKIKVQAGLVTSGGGRAEPVPCFLLALGASGVLWVIDGCLLPASSHCLPSVYLCV